MIETYSVDEVKQLLRRGRKSSTSSPNATEITALEYLQATRNLVSQGEQGVPDAIFEGFKVRLGDIWYKPDWVLVWPGGVYRELFEVKGTGKGWAGHRSREAMVRLQFLRYVVEPFGWRVFLLNVRDGATTEKEINP